MAFNSATSAAATLTVTPSSGMFDERVAIRITNVTPNTKLTLAATCKPNAEEDHIYHSYAHYVSSANGVIDVDTMTSHGGTYVGIEPMAWMWSMREVGVVQPWPFRKLDLTQPLLVTLTLHQGHVTVNGMDIMQSTADDVISRVVIERLYVSSNVIRTPVRQGRLRGVLYVPKGDGPFPGVISMWGGAPGLRETQGALLACKGFAVLSLAFFGYDDLPETTEHLDLEYFIEAVEWLHSLPVVQKTGIGVISLCYGGILANLLAIACDKVKAVAIFNTSSYLNWGEVTHKGKVMDKFIDMTKVVMTEDGISMCEAFPARGRPEIEHVVTPLERATNTHFLFMYGTGDMNTTYEHGYILADRLARHGKHNFKHVIYPGAGHVFEAPNCPLIRTSWPPFFGGMQVNWGGDCRAHAHAMEAAWIEIQQFFFHYLGRHQLNSRL